MFNLPISQRVNKKTWQSTVREVLRFWFFNYFFFVLCVQLLFWLSFLYKPCHCQLIFNSWVYLSVLCISHVVHYECKSRKNGSIYFWILNSGILLLLVNCLSPDGKISSVVCVSLLTWFSITYSSIWTLHWEIVTLFFV